MTLVGGELGFGPFGSNDPQLTSRPRTCPGSRPAKQPHRILRHPGRRLDNTPQDGKLGICRGEPLVHPDRAAQEHQWPGASADRKFRPAINRPPGRPDHLGVPVR